ncbi:rotatin-like isoform X3 [Oratosquilla oratoria]|uniref:rotatin-like isoform X3 n=1 Tax=Oratosquilla oratoria TaxID=337810 RepID=UPI003F76ACAC
MLYRCISVKEECHEEEEEVQLWIIYNFAYGSTTHSSKMSELCDYIDKLVHPIPEIQIRSLNGLLQKLECGTIQVKDLCRQDCLVTNLLSWLSSGPRAHLTSVFRFLCIVLQDPHCKSNFVSIGGSQLLRSMRSSMTDQAKRTIDEILVSCHAAQGCKHNYQLSEEPSEPGHRNMDICFDESNDTSLTLGYQQEIEGPRKAVEDDSLMDVSSLSNDPISPMHSSAILFSTFPWQPLTSSDRRVLGSTTSSFLSGDQLALVAAAHFLNTVLLKDFPPEVFLQRPAILEVLYGCLIENKTENLQVQTSICSCLCTLTRLLTTRIAHYKELHLLSPSYQEAFPGLGVAPPQNGRTGVSNGSQGSNYFHFGGGTQRSEGEQHLNDIENCLREVQLNLSEISVEEEADDDEFILLGMHQTTISQFCVLTLQAVSPLLSSTRARVLSSVFSLMLCLLELLEHCVCVSALWACQQQQAVEIVELFIQLVSRLNTEISSLHQRCQNGSRISFCQILICQWGILLSWIMQKFVPIDYAVKIFSRGALDAVPLLLYNAGFMMEYPDHHATVLQFFKKAHETSSPLITPPNGEMRKAFEIEALIYVTASLRQAFKFLETSSSEIEEFLILAKKGIETIEIHKSPVFVEKLVRGLAKQAGLNGLTQEMLMRGQLLIKQVLSHPEEFIRVIGYKSVLRLVTENVGVSQACNTKLTKAGRVEIILDREIMKIIIGSGMVDKNLEVSVMAEGITLGLLRAEPLITPVIRAKLEDCMRANQSIIVCLASRRNVLGKAVLNLMATFCKSEKTEEKKQNLLLCLLCLYNKEKESRTELLPYLLHILDENSSQLRPSMADIDPFVIADLLLLDQPVSLACTLHARVEKGQLLRSVEVACDESADSSVRLAAWAQLAFLLENPDCHKQFLNICSMAYLLQSLTHMLQVDGSYRGYTVAYLPACLEILHLLAIHSSSICQILKRDCLTLCLLLRGILVYKDCERVRTCGSCLLAFLIFSDEIEHLRSDIVLPKIAARLNLPFICEFSSLLSDTSAPSSVNTVTALVRNGVEGVIYFVQGVWTSVCLNKMFDDSDEKLDMVNSLAPDLRIGEDEYQKLKSSSLTYVIKKLLFDIENATCHGDVKAYVNLLELCIKRLPLCQEEPVDILCTRYWSSTFARFITCKPKSSIDEHLLIHILSVLSTVFEIANECKGIGNGAYVTPLLRFAFREFGTRDSAFYAVLQKSGAVSWMANDPNPTAILSIQTLQGITSVVRMCLRLIQVVSTDDFKKEMPTLLAKTMLPVLQHSADPQFYNLGMLECTLECLVDVTAVGNISEETSLLLAQTLTRIIDVFHVGRGSALNSYMGRGVTLHATVIITQIMNNALVKKWHEALEADSSTSLSWMVSVWVYRDCLVAAAGLSLAASIACTGKGRVWLYNGLSHVSGGVWGAALSYLLASNRSSLQRTAAAQLLLNLTSSTAPEDLKNFPVVADTVTGESLEGVAALMLLLEHCNFYVSMSSTFAQFLSKNCNFSAPQDMSALSWVSESQLSTMEVPAEEESGSRNIRGSVEGSNPYVSPRLVATINQLLANIVLMDPPTVVPQLSMSKTISIVVNILQRQVTRDGQYLAGILFTKTALNLVALCLKDDMSVGTHLGRDTSLALVCLAIVVYGAKTEIELVTPALKVLCGLLACGGMSALNVVHHTLLQAQDIFPNIVMALHPSSENCTQVVAAIFVHQIIHTGLTVTHPSYSKLFSTLSSTLDAEIMLVGEKQICPGWEVCRHLIRLQCGSYLASAGGEEQTQEPLPDAKSQYFLQSLKLLLLVSHSAKASAWHHTALLAQLERPLKELQEKVVSLNLHITKTLTANKTLNATVTQAIEHLQLITNWVHNAGQWCQAVGEHIIPLFHPLWQPILKCPVLLTAVVECLATLTQSLEVCALLTRTSSLPGCGLSSKKTSRPLMICLAELVTNQLKTLSVRQRSAMPCGSQHHTNLSNEQFLTSLAVLTNCSRSAECRTSIVKTNVISDVWRWIDNGVNCNKSTEASLTALRLIAVLTTHHEAQMEFCKIYGWVGSVYALANKEVYRMEAMIILANMSTNKFTVQALLASDMIVLLLRIVQTEDVNHIRCALVCLWAMAANNQRGLAALRAHPVLPVLSHIGHSVPELQTLITKIKPLLMK